MALRKQLRVKVLGNGEDIEADVTLSGDHEFGWRARIVAHWRGEELSHKTELFDHEREALAEAARWMRSHFRANSTWLVAISGSKRAA